METRTVTLDTLLKDGLFDVPSYQRSYSWEEPQLQDLLDDIIYLPESSSHFFGNVILDKQSSQFHGDGIQFDVYDVVDGQQRLISALLFLYVAGDQAGVLEDGDLVFPIRERPRLLPQDQDKEYFRDCLFGNANTSPETPSQVRLNQAQEFFEEAFTQLPTGVTVTELADRLRFDVRINVVEIDDESEAASIFESLNDRGKPLSALEKTKSFLMYMDERSSTSGALETIIKERFGSIYKELFVLSTGHKRINDFDEDSFQRFHWGMYDGYDSDEYFQGFETLKSRLQEQYRAGEHDAVQSKIDDYVQDLREAASAFAAMFTPSDHPEEVETALQRLLELGRLANVLPVLMASYLRYSGDEDASELAAIIRACETLVFRMYAIDNRRSNTGRGKLVNLAHEIHTDSSLEYEEIRGRIDSLTASYTDDDRFARRLRDPEFYDTHSSRDTKHLFFHYNRHLDVEADEDPDTNLARILSTEYQVEHILAQKVDTEHIPENLREDFGDYVHRLGNLTVASRYWNSSYGNLPFEQKKHAEGDREKDYASSSLRAQRELVDFDQFGREEIETRQEKLVEFSLRQWSIDPSTLDTTTDDQPEDYTGYVPPRFFDRLTAKQKAVLQILWDDGGAVETGEILRRMEEEHGIETSGSNTMSGLLAGMTTKYPDGYRRSIMSADWAGNEYEFRLVLDSEQKAAFTDHFGTPDK